MNIAPKYSSEAELDAVFRENNFTARRRHLGESNGQTISRHEHTISTESRSEEYREQILRMSKRQYGSSNRHQGNNYQLTANFKISRKLP